MRIIISIIIFLIFFTVGVFTLPHYGTNWDAVNHLPRGQAYLNFLLTGKKDFSNLPPKVQYWQNPDSLYIDTNIPVNTISGRSFYASDGTTYAWFMEHDGFGHPPASDILSALSNKIFFSRLRLVNDIDAYRVYGILLAAALVVLVFRWVSSQFGVSAGIVSSLALSLYPLFWAESHFNTEKDIPETVFWSFFIYSVWKAVTERRWRWMLGSGVFLGLALGTKLNIVFSALVVIPWFLFYIFAQKSKVKIDFKRIWIKNSKLILAAILVPIIGIVIFVFLWPYLWPDPIGRTLEMLKFYKQIGITTNTNPLFVGPFGTNSYPLLWIIYTTPLITLFLASFAIVKIVISRDYLKNNFLLLLLLWVLVPIARISLPGANVYGGVRQIMEYVPAFAMLAGIGSWYLRRFWRAPLYIIVFLGYLSLTSTFIKIHPNENVFFNSLVGGLSGAKSKNIPSWGNTFGAAYRQGVSYINKNAKSGDNVVLAYELLPNIPYLFFRQDINFHNSKRSGYLRHGEWAITLVYQGTENRSYYDTYLEKFLDPVFVAQVDGVEVLKVWKNEEQYLKINLTEKLISPQIEILPTGIRLDIKEVKNLSRLEIKYSEKSCAPMEKGYVQLSVDAQKWVVLYGNLPKDWLIPVIGMQPREGGFIEPFTGEAARYIDIVANPENTCLKQVNSVKLYVFEGLE